MTPDKKVFDKAFLIFTIYLLPPPLDGRVVTLLGLEGLLAGRVLGGVLLMVGDGTERLGELMLPPSFELPWGILPEFNKPLFVGSGLGEEGRVSCLGRSGLDGVMMELLSLGLT